MTYQSLKTAEPIESPSRPESPTAPRFYKPELDVLRFLAFFLVFVSHGIPNESTGYLGRFGPITAEWFAAVGRAGATGVDLFFALSSYLITELLLREVHYSGKLDVKAFYLRRILRIWPLDFFFLLFSALIIPRILPGDRLPEEYLLAFAFFLGNWISAFRGYPDSSAAPLWSISLEEQFYLIWPLVLRFTGPHRLAKVCIALLIVASACRVGLVFLGWKHPATWCITFTRLDPIAGGALVALWLRRKPVKLILAMRMGLIVAGFGALLLVARYLRFEAPPSLVMALLGYPAIALGALLILVAFASPWQFGTPRAMRAPWLVYLGRISYGLYVYHLFSIYLARRVAKDFVQQHFLPAQFIAGLALTIAFSAISYRLLEAPFLRLKARFTHVLSR